jgi:hypothetical protein
MFPIPKQKFFYWGVSLLPAPYFTGMFEVLQVFTPISVFMFIPPGFMAVEDIDILQYAPLYDQMDFPILTNGGERFIDLVDLIGCQPKTICICFARVSFRRIHFYPH